MKNLLYTILTVSMILIISCRKDFSTIPSQGNLSFSKDTVYLDTVFTNIGSSTYRLKVYNHSNEAIRIPSIALGNGTDSGYRINVDGQPGLYFENVDILAKDSLYIFIETTVDYSQITDPLYIDHLLFDTGSNEQQVTLVTLVQDAYFLYPNQNNGVEETLTIDGEETDLPGRYLTDAELTFTNEKPYVVYGYIAVGDANNTPKILTMEAGTKVHFHANSGLIVNPNSSLHILGSSNIEGQPETEVVIQGDRLEPFFEDVSGQWGLIWLREGSTQNIIQHATIKNAGIGLVVDGYTDVNTPTLTINHTQFYNHSQYGIYARHSNISGYNLVMNNMGLSTLALTQGGVYDFSHATIANYWNGGIRSYPTVLINNFYTEDQETFTVFDLDKASFTNCIIYGNNAVELLLDKIAGGTFAYQFESNLIRFNDVSNAFSEIPEMDFSDALHFRNNLLNESPDFKNPLQNEFQIGENSAGIGHSYEPNTMLYPTDFLGVTRANPADLGAYEHITF